MSIQREALAKIAAMDSEGVRADDLGRAAAIARAALSASTEQVPAVLPAEAITGFMGWLTCLERPVTLGSTMEAAIAADMVEAYRKSQGWDVPREDFASRLKRMPLAASPSAPTAVQPAEDALTPTERAACQQCGSDPHKMSCSVGGKSQLRLTADDAPAAVQSVAEQDEQSEQSAFESWLERTCPSGDVEDVQRQWEASSDFADWLESARATPTAVKEAGGVDADVIDEAAGFVRVAFGHGAADWNSGVDALAYELKRLLASAAQPATPVAPKTLEALTAEDIPDLWQNAADVPIVSRSGPPERWYLRGLQDGQRALAAKNNMTLGGV